nr:hypothetical protein [uncultured Actinotalea sp.]
MPREIVVLSPVPPDARALVEAGAAIDGRLGLRTLDGGAVHQLCRVETAADGTQDPGAARPVLSVHQPLQADDAAEVARLLPGPAASAVVDWHPPFWWVEALAPWGAAGDDGVAVAQELALRLGGVCVVQDGT